jgi:hypothetical protein
MKINVQNIIERALGALLTALILGSVVWLAIPDPQQNLKRNIAILVFAFIFIIGMFLFIRPLRKLLGWIGRQIVKSWGFVVLVISLGLISCYLFYYHQEFVLIGLIVIYTMFVIIPLIFWVRSEKQLVSPTYMKFESPTLIMSAEQNTQLLFSDFLLWTRCTIMFWVDIPEKDIGLRKSPDYRYLISHHTGERPNTNITYNLFALRRTRNDEWELIFSNNAGHGSPQTNIKIPDTLTAGWHHFHIAWDHTIPKLFYSIDGTLDINSYSQTYLQHWPERRDNNKPVALGSWVLPNPYRSSYCETSMFSLQIYDQFLELNHALVKRHLLSKPL